MYVIASFSFKDNLKIDSFTIPCRSYEKMSQVISKFTEKFKVDKDDFEFYYNGQKINEDSTIIKLTNSKNIEISIKKRSKIMKSPTCICNNCLIKIKKYKLNFSQCCHKHNEQEKIFEEYEESQRINYDRIICNANNFNKKQINSLEDFF